jgi:hypothetical protein
MFTPRRPMLNLFLTLLSGIFVSFYYLLSMLILFIAVFFLLFESGVYTDDALLNFMFILFSVYLLASLYVLTAYLAPIVSSYLVRTYRIYLIRNILPILPFIFALLSLSFYFVRDPLFAPHAFLLDGIPAEALSDSSYFSRNPYILCMDSADATKGSSEPVNQPSPNYTTANFTPYELELLKYCQEFDLYFSDVFSSSSTDQTARSSIVTVSVTPPADSVDAVSSSTITSTYSNPLDAAPSSSANSSPDTSD